MKFDQDTKFQDMDNTMDTSEMSTIRWVVMEQVRRTTRLMSREMRGGYWQEIINEKSGNKELRYVPDTREEVCNSIRCIYYLTKQKYNTAETKAIADIHTELETLKTNCIDQTEAQEDEVLSSNSYEDKDKVIVENYRFLKLAKYLEVFGQICKVLDRINWFDSGVGYVDEGG